MCACALQNHLVPKDETYANRPLRYFTSTRINAILPTMPEHEPRCDIADQASANIRGPRGRLGLLAKCFRGCVRTDRPSRSRSCRRPILLSTRRRGSTATLPANPSSRAHCDASKYLQFLESSSLFPSRRRANHRRRYLSWQQRHSEMFIMI